MEGSGYAKKLNFKEETESWNKQLMDTEKTFYPIETLQKIERKEQDATIKSY